MGDTLSQDEVDALLRGISTGDVPVEEEKPRRGEIREWDLLGDERSAGRRFPGLELVHERLVRALRGSFSQLLSTSLQVEQRGVEIVRYSSLRTRCESGSAFALCSLAPMRGQVLFSIPPLLAFQLVDRIFGGSGRLPPQLETRDYSASELWVLRRVYEMLVREIAEAWAPVVALEAALLRVESNPNLVSICPPEDSVVVLELSLDLGQGGCRILIATPFGSLEPFRAQLAQTHPDDGGVDQAWHEALARAVRASQVEVAVELGRRVLPTSGVLELKVGDVLRFDSSTDGALPVFIEGRPLLGGVAGRSRGQNAVRIVSFGSEVWE